MDHSKALMTNRMVTTDNVNCLVIIIAKDDNNIAALQFEVINHFDFFY